MARRSSDVTRKIKSAINAAGPEAIAGLVGLVLAGIVVFAPLVPSGVSLVLAPMVFPAMLLVSIYLLRYCKRDQPQA